MAVTTYNELYSLLKENEVYIEYNKGGDLGIMGLKMTLKGDLIPDSDESLTNHNLAIQTGEWALSGDSDGALDDAIRRSITDSTMSYPHFLKAFSTNYALWINLKIEDIKSVKVLGE